MGDFIFLIKVYKRKNIITCYNRHKASIYTKSEGVLKWNYPKDF